MLHKNTSQCKIPIVPEEDLKAGLASRNIVHRQKKHSTLCRFILHILYFRWLEILGLVGNFELKTFSQGGEV